MAIISRRSILRGLFSAPAIVAVSSLMPIRGLVMPRALTDSEIVAMLDNRLDQGEYSDDAAFVRYRSHHSLTKFHNYYDAPEANQLTEKFSRAEITEILKHL